MQPWLMVVIVAVGVFIASMFRAQQQQRQQQPLPRSRPPARQPPRDTYGEPATVDEIPSVLPAPRPPRRIMPPPLPPPRKVNRVEIVTVVPAPPPVQPPPRPSPATAVTPAPPLSQFAMTLRDMLRDPQAVRAAIVMREVLDPPLCRRRHGRFASEPRGTSR